VVVADECKIQKEPNRFCRWNLKCHTPVIKVDRNKDDTVSFYGGLSLKTKTEIGYVTTKHQTAKETCCFLEEIKKRYRGQGTVLLVWDGATHHLGAVKDWLSQNPGVVELFKFPPYCPDLNPQEHVWKALRAELATIVHRVTYSQLIDRACRFLTTQTFDYDFGIPADLI
jgi:transposase